MLTPAQVDERQDDGPLDLVGELTGEKYPRDVGFNDLHGLNRMRIGIGPLQSSQNRWKVDRHPLT